MMDSGGFGRDIFRAKRVAIGRDRSNLTGVARHSVKYSRLDSKIGFGLTPDCEICRRLRI
jgi:hypothetical protein